MVISVQFSLSVMSDSLRPHKLQHSRSPCPLPTPRVHPSPRPLSRWCHPTISSCVIPFVSWPQSFPASGSFQMSQLFASGGQSIGVSASTSVLIWSIYIMHVLISPSWNYLAPEEESQSGSISWGSIQIRKNWHCYNAGYFYLRIDHFFLFFQVYFLIFKECLNIFLM